jgi:GlpG protein
MRQIGVLPDALQARTLADYLLTLRIETQLMQEKDGWAVWVCDEDRVPQAREELEAFQKEPQAPKYTAAAPAAEAIRRDEDAEEQDYARRQTALRERMRSAGKPSYGRGLTLALLMVNVVVAVVTRLDLPSEERYRLPAMQALLIAPFHVKGPMIGWDELDAIRAGEVWRLITPIFIHMSFIHILFNLLVLHDLGGAIEMRRGPWRLGLLVLLTAVLSNVAQYYLGNLLRLDEMPRYAPSPLFGGFSGVNYGFFGYIWMKSRFEPELGLQATPNLVIIMVGWFFLCLTGLVGSIANVAHAAGLLVGMGIALAPVAWRAVRHHES